MFQRFAAASPTLHLKSAHHLMKLASMLIHPVMSGLWENRQLSQPAMLLLTDDTIGGMTVCWAIAGQKNIKNTRIFY